MYVLELIDLKGNVKWFKEYSSETHKDMLRVFTIIHTLVNNLKNNMGEELHGMEGFIIEPTDKLIVRHKKNV
jgi:hypothetical protein